MASRSLRRLSSHVRMAARHNSPAICGLAHTGQIFRTMPVDRIQTRKFGTPAKTEPDVDAIAYGFMASQALFTALELNLFDKLDQPRTLAELQKGANISAPRLQTLLTALTSVNLLWLEADGKYALPKSVAATMVTTSKYYYGDYLKLQIGRQFYVQMGHLPQVMSTGSGPDYAEWFADGETADVYTRAQHNGSLATAFALMKRVDLSSSKKVLDVGGGSGAFQVGMCTKFPDCKSYVLELPNVAETGEKIVATGHPEVKDRITFIKGSALDPWPADTPKDVDLCLMSYISGSVPEPHVQSLYDKAFAHVRPGGRFIVHDFMVNDDLQGPPLGALWALQHVAVNSEGVGLNPHEVSTRMKKSGFVDIEVQEMIKGMTKVLIAHKK